MKTRFLNYISHKLRIDAHYLYSGFVWILIATAIIFLANFLKSIAFANFLRPETFGTYRYILTIIEITSALSLSGMSLVISRSVAQGFEGTYVYGMIAYLKRSWVSVVATTSIALYYATQGNYPFAVTIGIAGLLGPLLNTVRLYGALLEGKKRSDLNAQYQIASTVLPALVMVATVFVTDSILVIILSYFISLLGVHAVLAYITHKIIQPNKEIDPKADSFTFHLSIMGTLSLIVEQIDKLLLFQFVGPAQLAAYTFASSLPEQFNVLGKSLRVLIYPKISTQSIDAVQKHIWRKAMIIFACCGFLFVGYVLIAPFVFNTFFAQYVQVIFLSQVYALSVFLIIATPYKAVLLAHSYTKELYTIKIVLMASRLSLLAFCLPLFGLWGVVFSYLVARFIEMFMTMYYVHFKIK